MKTKADEYREDIAAVPPELPKMPLVDRNGYLYGWTKEGWQSIARIVWEFHHGAKYLPKNFRPFHIDGNKRNNTIENLTLKRGTRG